MKKIDVHTHVVEFVRGYGRRGEFRAVGGGRARWANGEEMDLIPPELGETNVTIDRLAAYLREKQVEKAALLQGSFYGFQNEYSLEAQRKYPELFLAACTADPFALEAGEIIERFICREGVRVAKFEVSEGGGLMGIHEPFALNGPRFMGLVDIVARNGAALVLDLGGPGMVSFQPEAVAEIAARYPDMHIIICHLLAPGLGDEEALRTALETLRADNIWFDLSAVPWNVYPEAYPYPTGKKYIAMAKAIVGHKKLLWGSDLPCPLTRDSFEHLADYFQQCEPVFTEAELEDVYCNNALDAFPFER